MVINLRAFNTSLDVTGDSMMKNVYVTADNRTSEPPTSAVPGNKTDSTHKSVLCSNHVLFLIIQRNQLSPMFPVIRC